MKKPPNPDVVKISSPSDVILAVPQLLGFVATDSVVVLCTHEPRMRLGLAMRLDLDLATDPTALAEEILERVEQEEGDRRIRHRVLRIVADGARSAVRRPGHGIDGHDA